MGETEKVYIHLRKAGLRRRGLRGTRGFGQEGLGFQETLSRRTWGTMGLEPKGAWISQDLLEQDFRARVGRFSGGSVKKNFWDKGLGPEGFGFRDTLSG